GRRAWRIRRAAGGVGARASRANTTTTKRTSMGRRLTIVAVTVLVWLAVAGLFVLVVGGARSEGAGGSALFGPRVAIVELEGIITDVDDVVRDLKAHRENPAVRAVVMRINSPGGVVGPTQELHDA